MTRLQWFSKLKIIYNKEFWVVVFVSVLVVIVVRQSVQLHVQLVVQIVIHAVSKFIHQRHCHVYLLMEESKYYADYNCI